MQYVNAGRIHGAYVPPDLYSGQVDANNVPQLRTPLSAADQGRLLDSLYGSDSQDWRDAKAGSSPTEHQGGH
ncbi:hypothetical protein [Fodinicola feengrottensis]|uniref:Uncharacterized protein n=1 Tax=Fodinicola feengrottensis TaxID=435914 RepID=A0ABN2IPQ8_9ACTN|nr:hypothetical protein [Fodinicola feengrottensis]